MRGEQKNFGIRRARKHSVVHGFSNMVTIQRGGKKPSYVYINYAYALLLAVGKKLPQGVGDATPSAIVIMEIPSGWVVQAMYIMNPTRLYHLWTTTTLPEWAEPMKRKHDETHQPDSALRNNSATGAAAHS